MQVFCVYKEFEAFLYSLLCMIFSLVEQSHASVCAWVPTEKHEYSIIVALIITTNLLFVCYSFNSWFSADIMCEISKATASTYSLCRLGESCVANYILCRGVGGAISQLFLHLQYRIILGDHVLSLLPTKSYHSFQSELSSTSCLIVLFFRVLCNGPVREYHGLTMNMLHDIVGGMYIPPTMSCLHN
jgi:hypothetical protein